MRLAVFPHNVCWPSPRSPSGFATHGGIVLQIGCLSELFGATRVVMSCVPPAARAGEMPVTGRNLEVVPLRPLPRSRAWRLLAWPFWMARSGVRVAREMMAADAVFALVPGEIGTLVLLLALVLRRPLLVRYIIDWSAPRSIVDRVERWLLERFAGGRNVFLITGDGAAPPSARNRHLRWTFSTTLSEEDLVAGAVPRALPRSGPLQLVIVARQELAKGTDILMRSLPLLSPELGRVELAVVGEGSALPGFRALARELGLEDRVRFHGQVDHAQVLALLRAAPRCPPVLPAHRRRVVRQGCHRGAGLRAPRGDDAGVGLPRADRRSLRRGHRPPDAGRRGGRDRPLSG